MLRQAVILVGGLGTRLGSLTQATPKPMLPVAGEPFLDILLRNIARHGFEEILLLASFQADKIRAHYAAEKIAGCAVRVLEETERAGTAGALREALPHLDDVFLLSNGDSFFDINYLSLAQDHRREGAQLVVALRAIENVSRYGKVTVDDHNRIISFAEKQATGNGAGLINGGVYVVSRQAITDMAPGPASLEVDVIPQLVKSGSVYGKSYDGYFLDIGLPETYAQAQHELPAVDRRRVVFFDRDGTLTRDDGYTHRVKDLVFLPGAIEAIRRINDEGRLVVVVTNQAGIARGYYSESAMRQFHTAMQHELQRYGAHIDGFFFCPHHPDHSNPCNCRKPGIALFQQACEQFRINLDGAAMVGDSLSDLEAARAFGIAAIHADGSPLTQICNEI